MRNRPSEISIRVTVVIQIEADGCKIEPSEHLELGTSLINSERTLVSRRSFVEIRNLETEPAEFRDVLAVLEADALNRAAIRVPSPLRFLVLLLRGVTKDFAHFFLHAAAVAVGAALELGLHFRFEIADK